MNLSLFPPGTLTQEPGVLPCSETTVESSPAAKEELSEIKITAKEKVIIPAEIMSVFLVFFIIYYNITLISLICQLLGLALFYMINPDDFNE